MATQEKALKRLKDYPIHEWMETADGCIYCGAKNEIMILAVDESGDMGDIKIRRHHREDCLEPEFDEVFDICGWVFSHRKFHIADKEFPTLMSRLNTGPCLNCWKLIVGIPVILFPESGEYEIDFCDACVEELGILKAMLK